MRGLFTSILLIGIISAYGQSRLDLSVDAPSGGERIMAVLSNVANGGSALNVLQQRVGSGSSEILSQLVTYHPTYTLNPNTGGYTGLTNSNSGLLFLGSTSFSKMRFFIGNTNLANNRMTIGNAGVGIGIDDPRTEVHFASGTMFIEYTMKPILQAANGSCWELSVSTTGALTTATATCP